MEKVQVTEHHLRCGLDLIVVAQVTLAFRLFQYTPGANSSSGSNSGKNGILLRSISAD